MKIGFGGLTSVQLTGLLLGILGLIIPIFLSLESLSIAGQIGLGIFFMAAIFWMFEPIPIFATSMLVIFLQIVLLSAQGPVFLHSTLPVDNPTSLDGQTWQIPTGALNDGGSILIAVAPGKTETLQVDVVDRNGKHVLVRSSELTSNHSVVTNPQHRLVNYQPNSYIDYLGTLANPIIILFLGGFMLADASVKYNLDKNLTRYLLQPFGSQPRFILLGLMLVTAILSAFMSNTATAAMMITVVLPLISKLEPDDQFKYGLTLAIPIAANIGGITTPIGTPPNAIVIAALTEYGNSISFTDWVIIAAPLVIVMLIISWWLLLRFFPASVTRFHLNIGTTFNKSPKAISLYVIFGATVLLWMTENTHGMPGSLIAFLPIAALVTGGILNKNDIRNLPWEVLWLMAGGISLGIGMDKTGLAVWMISALNWGSFGYIALILAFGTVAIFMSTFLSNTVSATLLMPLVISLQTSGIMGNQFNLMVTSIVIAVACSMAMALPISTPPNAIAMSTGLIRTVDMAKIGVIIGTVGVMLILAYALFYWPFVIN